MEEERITVSAIIETAEHTSRIQEQAIQSATAGLADILADLLSEPEETGAA